MEDTERARLLKATREQLQWMVEGEEKTGRRHPMRSTLERIVRQNSPTMQREESPKDLTDAKTGRRVVERWSF